MKKTTKKRSGASKKANEGSYLLGKGGAGRAAKKKQSRRAANRSALERAMGARRGK